MDWQSSMGMYQFQQQPQDEVVEDDTEDFYGESDDAKAGAMEVDGVCSSTCWAKGPADSQCLDRTLATC